MTAVGACLREGHRPASSTARGSQPALISADRRGWGGVRRGMVAGGWDSKGKSPAALPPAARGAKRLTVTGATRRFQARASLSPCREDEARRSKHHSEQRERGAQRAARVVAAGALEVFTADPPATTYTQTAKVVEKTTELKIAYNRSPKTPIPQLPEPTPAHYAFTYGSQPSQRNSVSAQSASANNTFRRSGRVSSAST